MMKIAYEEVPDEFVELSEARKGETDFNNFVKKHWPGNPPSKSPEIKRFMNVNVPVSSQECPEVSNEKSDILVLPISLQDESSTTGTASILEELAEILRIPLPDDKNYLLFDPVKLQFDIEDARRRFIFLKSMDAHKKEHENIISEHEQHDRGVVALELQDGTNLDAESNEDEDEIVPTTSKRHLQELRKAMKDVEGKFRTSYSTLKQRVSDAMQSPDRGTIIALIDNLKGRKMDWQHTVDQYDRTLLHAAVEDNSTSLPLGSVILQAGFNPNSVEGCGATPLTLAVLQNNVEMCKLLMQYLASTDGQHFIKIPSPRKLASHLGYNHIIDMFDKCAYEKNDDLDIWKKYYADNSEVDTPTKANVTDDLSELFSEMECSVPEFKLSRKECPQMVVGDGATTKNIRSARHNNLSRYSIISEFSGDFHCSGYVEECFAKAQGPGGLYHAVNKVLGKTLVT